MGGYCESILEALYPLATKRDIRQQIVQSQQAIRKMLWIVYGMAATFAIAALAVAQFGDWHLSVALMTGMGSAIAVGMM